MEIKTKLRETDYGLYYDIYVNGVYSATAYGAKELGPILKHLVRKYQ
jgi:hypothetical protein